MNAYALDNVSSTYAMATCIRPAQDKASQTSAKNGKV